MIFLVLVSILCVVTAMNCLLNLLAIVCSFDAVMQGGDMCSQIALIPKRFFTMLAIENLDTFMHGEDMFSQAILTPKAFVTKMANEFFDALVHMGDMCLQNMFLPK